MPRTYNDVECRECFEVIWKFWKNKERASAAQSSVKHWLRTSELPFETLKLACEIYTGETISENFTYQLGNFIHGGHWQDVLQGCQNPEEYKNLLDQKKADAHEVINTWNNTCRPHWFKTRDESVALAYVSKALQDHCFKTNWKISLDKLAKIFHYKFRDSDRRSKININLRWFCDTSHDKHTVLKILEGDFGYPETPIEFKSTPKLPTELSEEEQKQLEADYEEVFGHKLGEQAKNQLFKQPKKDADSTSGKSRTMETTEDSRSWFLLGESDSD